MATEMETESSTQTHKGSEKGAGRERGRYTEKHIHIAGRSDTLREKQRQTNGDCKKGRQTHKGKATDMQTCEKLATKTYLDTYTKETHRKKDTQTCLPHFPYHRICLLPFL
jgi:hypothetical protein